VTFLKLVYTSQ